jgi:hypothetical protein
MGHRSTDRGANGLWIHGSLSLVPGSVLGVPAPRGQRALRYFFSFPSIRLGVFHTPDFEWMPDDHYPHDLYVVYVLCAFVFAFFAYAFWDVGQLRVRKAKDKKASMYKSV